MFVKFSCTFIEKVTPYVPQVSSSLCSPIPFPDNVPFSLNKFSLYVNNVSLYVYKVPPYVPQESSRLRPSRKVLFLFARVSAHLKPSNLK